LHFDALFTAQRLKLLFKRSKEDGPIDIVLNILDFPINFLRDYTIPPGHNENWDRKRMTFVPITISFAAVLLFGVLDDWEEDKNVVWICTALSIFGVFVGLTIRYRTKITSPPEWLVTVSSILCFGMSIAWIKFTSDLIVDLLKLFGKITGIVPALLNLTILAWGNCLGDMSADVAMTKKGFGEMAITATVAGPIFNVLMGGFLSTLFYQIGNSK
jgi:sodium/potassium/calcium exchanger 6